MTYTANASNAVKPVTPAQAIIALDVTTRMFRERQGATVCVQLKGMPNRIIVARGADTVEVSTFGTRAPCAIIRTGGFSLALKLTPAATYRLADGTRQYLFSGVTDGGERPLECSVLFNIPASN